MNVYLVSYENYASSDKPETLGIADSMEKAKELAYEWCKNRFLIFETIEEAKYDDLLSTFIWNSEISSYELFNIKPNLVYYPNAEIHIEIFEVKE